MSLVMKIVLQNWSPTSEGSEGAKLAQRLALALQEGSLQSVELAESRVSEPAVLIWAIHKMLSRHRDDPAETHRARNRRSGRAD
uniref:hypothetical protein n=1 Tax=Microbacterium sp. K36 TaxID=2305439 RepID=UPI00109CB58C|nr:hypothetical protein [Microbacterium sp. K36]